eukprot:2227931-Prymnesium_polylepis.1
MERPGQPPCQPCVLCDWQSSLQGVVSEDAANYRSAEPCRAPCAQGRASAGRDAIIGWIRGALIIMQSAVVTSGCEALDV